MSTTTADRLTVPAAAPAPAEHPSRVGLAYALAAYLAWGFVPAYFKLLTHVSPLQVLSHRVVWSVAFLALLLVGQRRGREVLACLRDRRTTLLLAGSTVMIATNWYVFIWAISAEHV